MGMCAGHWKINFCETRRHVRICDGYFKTVQKAKSDIFHLYTHRRL